MRKVITLLSTIMLVSMLLVACAGEETSTVEPATQVPPATEEPTTEATEEPSGTGTVSPDGTGTPVGGIPVTGEEDPSRLSNQLDYTVWNMDGEQIGEVNDMVVDLDNTRISYVIVGTGGFLEIGERDIFVPWESLQLSTEGGDMTGGNQFAFILQAEQDMFVNAPDIDVNTVLPAMGEAAGDWDDEIRSYWEGGGATSPSTTTTGTPATGTGSGTTTATPSTGTGTTGTGTPGTGTTGTGTPGAGTTTIGTGTPGTGGTGATTGDLQGVLLASELLGSTITVGADGQVSSTGTSEAQGTGTPQTQPTAQSTGTAAATAQPSTTGTPGTGTGVTVKDEITTATIDDVIVDIDTGDIKYIVITSTFTDGDRWIPIPLSQFQWDAGNGTFVLNLDQAMLLDAPFFLDGEYPSMMTEGWDTDYLDYWQ